MGNRRSVEVRSIPRQPNDEIRKCVSNLPLVGASASESLPTSAPAGSECKLSTPIANSLTECELPVPIAYAMTECKLPVPVTNAPTKCELPVPITYAMTECKLPVPAADAPTECEPPLPITNAPTECKLPVPIINAPTRDERKRQKAALKRDRRRQRATRAPVDEELDSEQRRQKAALKREKKLQADDANTSKRATKAARKKRSSRDTRSAVVLAAPPQRPPPFVCTMSSTNTPTSAPDCEHIVVVDASNVCLSAQAGPGKTVDACIRIDVANLTAVIEHGRVCRSRIVGGSVNLWKKRSEQSRWAEWKASGYTVILMERGQSGHEAGVDDMLHAHILQDLVLEQRNRPQKLLLATGDGNVNCGRTSFPSVVESAIRCNYDVELWSWRNNLNPTWPLLAQKHPSRLTLCFFDDYRQMVTYSHGRPVSSPNLVRTQEPAPTGDASHTNSQESAVLFDGTSRSVSRSVKKAAALDISSAPDSTSSCPSTSQPMETAFEWSHVLNAVVKV